MGMLGLTHFSLAIPETAFGGVKDSGFGSDGCVKGLDALMTPFWFPQHKVKQKFPTYRLSGALLVKFQLD
jgi:acyl-CoA reductase-like NAD-dependent aldehyde dehydrogenase